MNPDWPGACFDHYESFLGSPAGWQVSLFDGETKIQLLRFGGLFDGCDVLCSIGFAQFSTRVSPHIHQEVVMAVDEAIVESAAILVSALFYIGSTISTIPLRASRGGLSKGHPEFAQTYPKDAIYFTGPTPFPDGFREVNQSSTAGRVLGNVH